MSIAKKIRSLAFIKDRIQRLSKYRKINVSPSARGPATAQYLKRSAFDPLIKIIKSEASSIAKVRLDFPAILAEQNLLFTSKNSGQNANLLSMVILDSKSDGSAEVKVFGLHIVVEIEDGVTDFDTIVAAFAANPLASRLVDVELTGDGIDTASAMETKFFTSGR